MKKLPISIQTFENIIRGEMLYVDKTEFIYNLTRKGKYYFFARPRRFGKSLLLTTLKSFFLGKKELFKDLYIYDSLPYIFWKRRLWWLKQVVWGEQNWIF